MEAFYDSQKRGHYLSILTFAGVVGIVVVAIVLHSAAVGVAAVISAAAAVVWAMRRNPEDPSGPTDLSNGEALEGPRPEPERR